MAVALTTSTLFAQVPSYVPTNGLVGYWPFNGNANDESGNGINGTIMGPSLTTDRFGNTNSAFDFNYSNANFSQQNQEIYIPYNPLLNVENITVSYWIFARQYFWTGNPNLTVNIARFQYGYSNPNGQVWGIGYTDSQIIGGLNGPLGGGDYQAIYSSAINLNAWNNIVMTYNGDLINLYMNSILIASIPHNLAMNTSGNSGISIGENNSANGFWQYTDGKIDDIGIWNRALTQQEITNLYNSTSTNECLTMTINTGVLSTNPVTYTSTVNIYPNPANDQITIDCGNLANVVGWNIKITNMLGQEVFNQPMNTQQYVVPLNSWTGQGMYFVKISNAQNEVVNIKKIILQ